MRHGWTVSGFRKGNSGRLVALLAVAAVGCLAVGAAYLLGKGFMAPSIEAGTPLPSVPELATDERAYYDFVAPRLRELSAQTHALGDAAASKSRNLLDIQNRGDRVKTLVREINGYADRVGTPPRFTDVSVAYRAGAENALVAMREAQQGFLRLDWDRVASAVPTFGEGSAQLDAAVSEIERAGGQATGSIGTPPAQ